MKITLQYNRTTLGKPVADSLNATTATSLIKYKFIRRKSHLNNN